MKPDPVKPDPGKPDPGKPDPVKKEKPMQMARGEAASAGSTSFLVRLWREPRESEEGAPVRVYVRNLKTGEEHYLGDPRGIADYLMRGTAADAEDRDETDADSRAHAG